jgi:ABC-type enterochelin transport system substrate-binding protein
MIKQTAYKVVLGLFMLAFIMVACNNKSEKKTETDTTKVDMMDTTNKMMDTTNMSDTSLKKKPTEQGDRPPAP